jgi:ABC-2 type transport system ATP-binding protein
MAEEIVEVACAQQQEALAMVEGLPGVRHASLFGRGLHVVTAHAEATIPDITGRLAAAGLLTSRPERIVPSLEDVFVSLIEARDRQSAPVVEVAR